MLTVEMLPAGNGDCLWIEYGPPGDRRVVLIDGGTAPTYKRLRERLDAMPKADRRVELLVVSHVDGDHIDGALKLIQDVGLGVQYGDVWFNGWKHLVARDELGPVAGEKLSKAIRDQKLRWNRAFGGEAVCVTGGPKLPEVELDGGLRLTLLSPYRQQLADLAPKWEKVVRAAGLEPGGEGDAPADLLGGEDDQPDEEPGGPEPPDLLGPALDVRRLAERPFAEDDAEANGSSIALLAEYAGRRVLLAADAFPSVLELSLGRIGARDGPVHLDAVKVSHHGSQRNTSPGLLTAIDCSQYLVSSNGARHHHPDREAIARIVFGNQDSDVRTQLVFNYRTTLNDVWDDREIQDAHNFIADFPADEDAGARVVFAD
jgi:hypothetical protein